KASNCKTIMGGNSNLPFVETSSVRTLTALFFGLLATLVLLTETPASAGAETDLQQLRDEVKAKLIALKADATYPGVTVGIILADGRSTGVSVGLADVENKIPLKPTDRLLAGSIGKTFVAAVALQLVEEGKIGLDDKLETWLGKEPWFGRLPNGRDLTIRNLMNHTSGLIEYFDAKGCMDAVRADPF